MMLTQANHSDRELEFLQSVDTEHGINGINKLPTQRFVPTLVDNGNRVK